MTHGRPATAGNPAPRVSTCVSCGGRFEAGPRGPLPRRCPPCRRPRVLVQRIVSARRAALDADAPMAVVRMLDDALGAARAWRDAPGAWRDAL